MASVAVRRLALSAPPTCSSEARLRVEEALRLTANEDDRLFLLRRFDFGSLPAMARPSVWQARAEAQMRSLTSRAVHAGQAGAASSDAVWFRSIAEARSMLLQILASGQTPDAWFWRLAVPDWRGSELEHWLPQLLMSVESDRPALVMFARAIVSGLTRSPGARLIRALAALPDRWTRPSQLAGRQTHSSRAPPSPLVRGNYRIAQDALRYMARHDPEVRAALARQIVDEMLPLIARHWLARFALLAVAPDIAPESERCNTIETELRSAAFWSLVSEPEVESPPVEQDVALPTPSLSTRGDHGGFGDRSRQSAKTADNPSLRERVDATVPGEVKAGIVTTNAPFDRAAKDPIGRPVICHLAGLWLLIPSLRRLGLGEWIARREDEGAEGFGPALLRHVGRHYGLANDDPLLKPLPDDVDAPTGWLNAWRIGTDRWLRRKAGIRLCDIVRRRGSFGFDGLSVTIGFDHELADVRLRRRALDLDPGWVDWLGLSVRYRYFDRGRHDMH